jgi:hypothetical protein
MNDPNSGLQQAPSDVLSKIKKKAQQLADMHGSLADFNQRWQNGLRYGTLFFSVTMLALTFAPDDFIIRTTPFDADSFKWLKAGVATLNFFAGLVLSLWRPSDQEARHREAIKHYTQALYEIREIEERGNCRPEDVCAIKDKYLDDTTIPRIPSRDFLKLKQRYLIKVQVSQFLERHPYVWVPWLRFRLRLREFISGEMPHDSEKGS